MRFPHELSKRGICHHCGGGPTGLIGAYCEARKEPLNLAPHVLQEAIDEMAAHDQLDPRHSPLALFRSRVLDAARQHLVTTRRQADR